MHILDKHLTKLHGKERFGAHIGSRVGALWAAVEVEAKKKGRDLYLELVRGSAGPGNLELVDPEKPERPGKMIGILKSETLVYRLPDTIKVYDNGEEVTSERGGFWITTETFDPYHMLCDGLPPAAK